MRLWRWHAPRPAPTIEAALGGAVVRESDPDMPEEPWDNGQHFAILYHELKRLAAAYMRRQRPSHTLQPTALVSEAFLKLQRKGNYASVEHFKAAVAKAMKQILIDHARGKNRQKRSTDGVQVPLDSVIVEYESRGIAILDLDEALRRYRTLGQAESMAADAVELRMFGLSMDEIAYYLGMKKRTLERAVQLAKAWLHRELGLDGAPG